MLHEWDTIKINKYQLTPSVQGGGGWLVTEREQGWVYGVKSYFREGCRTVTYRVVQLGGEWGFVVELKCYSTGSAEFTWESFGLVWFDTRSILDASRFYRWRLFLFNVFVWFFFVLFVSSWLQWVQHWGRFHTGSLFRNTTTADLHGRSVTWTRSCLPRLPVGGRLNEFDSREREHDPYSGPHLYRK